MGLGENRTDRIGMLHQLASLEPAPESVPINTLVPIEGTPMAAQPSVPWDQLVRVVATARLLMPTSTLRLSAGRHQLSEETQALCLLAGANAVFLGERLLTTDNAGPEADLALFEKLGLEVRSARRE